MVDFCKFNIFEERLIMFYEFDNIMKLLDSLFRPPWIFNLEALNGLISNVVYSLGYI